MKRLITALAMLLTLTASVSAMSYEQAREQALFLTDKMAYELNLTEEQYDAAYEINLDYLMSVNTPDDLYEAYWRQRNIDLSYVLLDWQYRAFCAATYFYRPLYWISGVWHFAIYSRYPRRNYLYFGQTNIYITYRGGHSWRHNGGRSWYKGRTFNHGGNGKGYGMRDRFNRGEFKAKGNRGSSSSVNVRNNSANKNTVKRQQNNNTSTNGTARNFKGNRNNYRSNRESSTRTTARTNGSKSGTASFSGSRRLSSAKTQRQPSNTFSPKRNVSKPSVSNGSTTRKATTGSSKSSSVKSSSSKSSGGSSKGNFGGRR